MHTQQVQDNLWPLLGTQQGIWFAQQVMPNPEEFNVAHYVEIEGQVDTSIFRQAVAKGLNTADSLHCRYVEVEGVIKQQFQAGTALEDVLEVFDFSHLEQPKNAALEWMEKDLQTVIDIQGNERRYRHCLIQIGSKQAPKWLWYQRYHHIDVDGFSFNAISQNITRHYNHMTLGTSEPEGFTPMAKVVAEHGQFTGSEQYDKARYFWKEAGSSLPAPPSLTTGGTDKARFGVVKQHISLRGGDWLHAQGNDVLPSELAMALVFAYLHLHSGNDDVCVGFPFMRRMGSSAMSASGAVVNVLPLAFSVDKTMSIADVARVMNKAIRQARRYQMYDAEQISRDLGKVGQPLYGPMLNFKPFEDVLHVGGNKSKTHILSAGPIDDIEFSPALSNSKLEIEIIANAQKYNTQSLTIHADRFANMVEQIAQTPSITLAEIALVPQSEQQSIADWSVGNRWRDPHQDKSVLDVFERNAAQKTDETALVYKQQKWSFQSLREAIEQRAAQLRTLGIKPKHVVGVALPRSPETVITMLAIMRCGGAYLPIDLDYPQERIETILEQAQPQTVIVEDKENLSWGRLANCTTLAELTAQQISTPQQIDISKHDVAYIVFTSGSTGKPKGVMNTHGALLNLLHSHQNSIFAKAISSLATNRSTEPEKITVRASHTTSFSFDASWEQVIWMLCGHTLYLYDDDQRKDAYELVKCVANDRIDAMDLPPSLFNQMLDSGLMEQVYTPTLVLIGSEAVPEKLWERVGNYPQLLVENFYGPTEFTVDAVSAPLNADTTPVIGRPILNAKAYVLNNALQEVPVGVAGELYLAGAGLAKGYLNQPGMTADRFVANPFEHGQIMYRTGDLVKWHENGQLDFIGRTDDQVKIRGFRIELGDVESAINNIPGVDSSVVIAERFGDSHRLIAYCTLVSHAKGHTSEQQLLDEMSQALPEYMVPAGLMILDAFTLNVNGKIDRKSLPNIDLTNREEVIAPVTAEEVALCSAIAELLGVADVGISDDFFNLGGDSISAMGLGTILRKVGFELRPKEIFAARRVGDMAKVMKPLNQQEHVAQEGQIKPLPMWQWFEDTFSEDTSYVQSVFVEIEADVTLSALQRALAKLVSMNSVCRLIKKESQYYIESIDQLDVASWVEHLTVDELKHADIDAIFDQYGKPMSLANSQLLRLVMLSDSKGQCGLIILALHLLIDGVSWRVLLPQLKSLTRAEVSGHDIVIPNEVTGINTWSHALHNYLDVAAQQMADWRARESRSVTPFKPAQEDCRVKHCRNKLAAATTERVLEFGQLSESIDIEEILLSSVSAAIANVFGNEAIKFNLESHGREEFDSSINLSQTMGWFTTEYPLVVALPESGTTVDLLREVKQAKRSIKDKGLGYMALLHLDNPHRNELKGLASRYKSSVLFNYLGRFEQSSEKWSPQSRAGKFADTFAVLLDSEQALQHDLELNIFVDENAAAPAFALNWSWNEFQFSQNEIDVISDKIEENLNSIADWLSSRTRLAEELKVAAELTVAGISLPQASSLEKRYGELSDVLPALPLQEGLLFQSQLGDENSNYNSTTRLTFNGEINIEHVKRALNVVISRHPQLKAKFDSDMLGKTVQLIPKELGEWPIESHSITSMEESEQQAYLTRFEKSELTRQFDLSNPEQSLLNASVIYHGDNQSTLYISAHHLVVDGWSTPILLRDFLTAYACGVDVLTPISASYPSVVEQLTGRDKKAAQQRWVDVLQGVNPAIAFEDIPVTDKLNELELFISEDKTRVINQLLRHYGLTMNSLMQGVWSSILGSMMGREDVVFGTPISGRFGHVEGIDEHIGLFSNTIPVRMKLKPDLSLLEQLKAHQEIQIQLLEHDELGLGEIQQLAGGETLFDTLLVVENYPDHSDWFNKDYAGAQLCDIHNRGYTHYPLTSLVLPGEQIHILFEYRDTAGIAEQVMQRFEQVLDAIIASPEASLTQLDLRLADEVELQQRVNQTKVALPEQTLRSLMVQQAEKTPEKLALIDEERSFTYREMRGQVKAIAELLWQHNVSVGDIVAVALPRSTKLSLAFNSIIECGAAYLPLDVGYPDERLAYMVNDAKPKLIITTSEHQARFSAFGELLILDELPKPVASTLTEEKDGLAPYHGAYIIYTSGSTGNPKGVLVSHQAIVNRLKWMQHEYTLNAQDVVLQKTPCSFDVSVWEFFWPLIEGASLVMAPPESHKDPEWLMQIINDYKVTTMHFVPSMLAAFMASIENSHEQGERVARSLQRVFCSGEALSKELSNQYARWIEAPLHNLYGPTEAAVDVTYCPAFGSILAESLGTSVPIGLPVWNTQVYVLDSFLRETPVGVPGELYLAGDQLAIGYLNRSGLTADRFIANPFSSGERMYRTGDVVRWLPSGKIEYLGRSDDQLKIRGQRIELGEIETALQSLAGVKQALVCAKSLSNEKAMAGADDRQLVGYAILNDGVETESETLRSKLAEHLPAHMVPVAIILMEEYPLSANGKLDRKALPLPSDVVTGSGRTARPGMETQLVSIFADVLGLDTLSAEDDFFALGGHSLMAMKLAADIRRILNVPVTIGQIMVNPTPEKLTALLLDDEALNDPTLAGFGEVLPIRAGSGPALFCINSASGFAWQYTGLPKYLDGHYPVFGLQSPRPNGAISAGRDMEDACDIHMKALKQLQPEGPYHLLGYSFGGTVAQALASKLQRQGEEVAFLGLLDTYPPEGQDWEGPMNEEAQDEIEREKDLFLDANDITDDELDKQRMAMFKDITSNYEDAVRLLSSAKSSLYDGEVNLFVAERTLPEGYDIDAHWKPFITSLHKHYFECSHEDIIAPENVGDVGEQLNTLLSGLPSLK
ncbi:TPA: amino acid adenylation domain-containing protein [Vibrio diabolicus]